MAIGARNAWGVMTDHLIAWDTPALPDYARWKGALFTGEHNHILHARHEIPGWVGLAPFVMTVLGFLVALTGVVVMFLAFAHLYQMLVHPGLIGPYASADRVWSGIWWPFYLVLLVAVEIHGGVGLYRLSLKWGWVRAVEDREARIRLRKVKWWITGLFLLLGIATLLAYMKIGYEHSEMAGERYLPTALEGS